jgi:anti-anti-sigma factor
MEMTGDNFKAQVRQGSELATIDLAGEINAFAENELNRAYTEAEDADPQVMVLNFKEVTYINSTGIALIVGLLARARKAHRKMVVFGLSDHYVEIFEITRLADFMSIYPDESSVLTNVETIRAS